MFCMGTSETENYQKKKKNKRDRRILGTATTCRNKASYIRRQSKVLFVLWSIIITVLKRHLGKLILSGRHNNYTGYDCFFSSIFPLFFCETIICLVE